LWLSYSYRAMFVELWIVHELSIHVYSVKILHGYYFRQQTVYLKTVIDTTTLSGRNRLQAPFLDSVTMFYRLFTKCLLQNTKPILMSIIHQIYIVSIQWQLFLSSASKRRKCPSVHCKTWFLRCIKCPVTFNLLPWSLKIQTILRSLLPHRRPCTVWHRLKNNIT
jgi:hypothetical protein